MKAAVYKGKQRLEVEDVPTPRPGPGQVLVKVKYCAICGTDVHLFQYDKVQPGSILGHEWCGVITDLGEGVKRWKVGDRVTGGGGEPPHPAPHRLVTNPRFTYYTMGAQRSTSGAYAEYVVLDAWRPLPIPPGVSDEAAAMTEPCAVAVRAVSLSRLRLGDTVAVLGAGPIGLLCLQVARAQGAGAVYVSEPAPFRAKAALELGADKVIDPTKCDVVAEMVALTGGAGPHIAFECAAAQPTLQQALDMVRAWGQVVLASLAWENVPVRTVDWVGREVELKGTGGTTPEGWAIALELFRQGKVRVGPMVTKDSYVPLERIQEAFVSLMRPSTQLKVLIVP
ncbi:MAG: zinc-binding dehydrogenase [Chloroflexota bacterium]|nr:zinc-binding dehydrogenase [Chloroflexota bacterium]